MPGPFAVSFPAVVRWLVRAWSVGAFVLLGWLGPAPALAHPGGEPFIHVPLTDVAPGSSFPVIVADLGTGETISFELLTAPTPIDLGDVPGTRDGHFETTLQLPESTPDGYVQLRAAIPDGTKALTWIHVAAGPGVAPTAGGDSFEYVPLLAGAFAVGSLTLLLLLTRRRPSRQPVRQ